MILIAPQTDGDRRWQDTEIQFVALKRRTGMLGRVLAVIEALRAVRALQPQVCHLQDFDLVFAIPVLRVLTDSRLVYDVHEFYPESIVQQRIRWRVLGKVACRFLAMVEGHLAAGCDLVVCAVEPLARRFRRRNHRVLTVLNYPRLEMIDHLVAAPPGWLQDAIKTRRVILYQGTISVDRGLFLMIEAMRLLRRAVPDAMLVLIGGVQSAERAAADELIRSGGLEGAVKYVDAVEHREIFPYIRACDVGLVPFLAVGQYPWAIPIKLFEYMACSVPVVAADLPAVAPFVRSSECGVLFEPGNARALADAVCQVLGEPGNRYGLNGRSAVCRRWNWARMEDRLLQAYGAMLRESTRRS